MYNVALCQLPLRVCINQQAEAVMDSARNVGITSHPDFYNLIN
jgi:hypothetical protein